MRVYRADHKKNFTITDNTYSKDKRISPKSKGIMRHLLEVKKTWKFSVNGIASSLNIGRYSTETGLIELENAGYLKRIQKRDEKGRFTKVVWKIFEIPQKVTNLKEKRIRLKKCLPKTGYLKPENQQLPSTEYLPSTEILTTPKSAPIREPSPEEKVVVSLDKLNITFSLKIKLSKEYPESEINKAVERCLNWQGRANDNSGILTALKNAKTWNDAPSGKKATEANLMYLQNIAHLDNQKCEGITLLVGANYIEFAGMGNQRPTVFDAKDTGMKNKLLDFLTKSKINPRQFGYEI